MLKFFKNVFIWFKDFFFHKANCFTMFFLLYLNKTKMYARKVLHIIKCGWFKKPNFFLNYGFVPLRFLKQTILPRRRILVTCYTRFKDLRRADGYFKEYCSAKKKKTQPITDISPNTLLFYVNSTVFLQNSNALRLSRFFNKSTFSRNRQTCVNIVLLGLVINIIAITGLNSLYYKVTPTAEPIVLLLIGMLLFRFFIKK